jgi:hypothetical protein
MHTFLDAIPIARESIIAAAFDKHAIKVKSMAAGDIKVPVGFASIQGEPADLDWDHFFIPGAGPAVR